MRIQSDVPLLGTKFNHRDPVSLHELMVSRQDGAPALLRFSADPIASLQIAEADYADALENDALNFPRIGKALRRLHSSYLRFNDEAQAQTILEEGIKIIRERALKERVRQLLERGHDNEALKQAHGLITEVLRDAPTAGRAEVALTLANWLKELSTATNSDDGGDRKLAFQKKATALSRLASGSHGREHLHQMMQLAEHQWLSNRNVQAISLLRKLSLRLEERHETIDPLYVDARLSEARLNLKANDPKGAVIALRKARGGIRQEQAFALLKVEELRLRAEIASLRGRHGIGIRLLSKADQILRDQPDAAELRYSVLTTLRRFGYQARDLVTQYTAARDKFRLAQAYLSYDDHRSLLSSEHWFAVLTDQNKYRELLSETSARIAVIEAADGRKSYAYLQALIYRAKGWMACGSVEKGEADLLTGLALGNHLLKGDARALFLEYLNETGKAFADAGFTADALALRNRLVSEAKRAFGKDSPAFGTALLQKAATLLLMRKPLLAEKSAGAAATILSKHSSHVLGHAEVLRLRAIARALLDAPEDALRDLESSRRLLFQHRLFSTPTGVGTLTILGYMLSRMSQDFEPDMLRRALGCLVGADRIADEIGENSPAESARRLRNIRDLAKATGYATLEEWAEEKLSRLDIKEEPPEEELALF